MPVWNMCVKNFQRFRESNLTTPMEIMFSSMRQIREPQGKRSWIMFLRRQELCLNILLPFGDEVGSSELAWAPTKRTLYASQLLNGFWGTGKRRRGHEEESFRTVDGYSPRVGDLVGFLTFNLFLLGRGH